jgi:hypothetical protein
MRSKTLKFAPWLEGIPHQNESFDPFFCRFGNRAAIHIRFLLKRGTHALSVRIDKSSLAGVEIPHEGKKSTQGKHL